MWVSEYPGLGVLTVLLEGLGLVTRAKASGTPLVLKVQVQTNASHLTPGNARRRAKSLLLHIRYPHIHGQTDAQLFTYKTTLFVFSFVFLSLEVENTSFRDISQSKSGFSTFNRWKYIYPGYGYHIIVR